MTLILRNIASSEVRRTVRCCLSSRPVRHPAIPGGVTPPNYKLVQKSQSDSDQVIDPATIEHLERISLVDFANVAGIKRLEEAVKLAEVVTRVDTTGVEPLYSILEDESLRLREDVAEPPNNRNSLMKMATCSEEDYFVSPPGNVPLSLSLTSHNKYSEDQTDS